MQALDGRGRGGGGEGGMAQSSSVLDERMAWLAGARTSGERTGPQGRTNKGGSWGWNGMLWPAQPRGLHHPVLALELCCGIVRKPNAVSSCPSAGRPQVEPRWDSNWGMEGEEEGFLAGSWESQSQDPQVPGRAGPMGENLWFSESQGAHPRAWFAEARVVRTGGV